MKKNFVSAGIIFLLVIMVGCNTATSPEIGGENGTVTGEIKIDGKTNDVFGRQILVLGTSYFASIDESGKYVISDIPAKTDYTLCFVSDSYRYIVKRNVEVKAKETTNIEEVNISSSEWKEYKFTWLGEKDNAPENAQKNQAYYNKQDGCSYIYNGSGWELLVKGGDDGKDGVNGTDGAVGAENYVEVTPTDRGIKFSAKILNNTNLTGPSYYSTSSSVEYHTHYVRTSVTFSITEKESGIKMVRDWEKSAGWNVCDMYYPFVEKDKEYTFEFSADKDDYNLYKGEFTVKATGGLGEFKIENVGEYKVVLTPERVIQNTGTAKYTENPNVTILNKSIYFTIYTSDWEEYIWAETVEGENAKLDLKEVRSWKTFKDIDNRLKGRTYLVSSCSVITVAGYQDNGQTRFFMNDNQSNNDEKNEWEKGSEKTKVYVILGEFPSEYYNGLPGETIMMNNGIAVNCIVMDYYDKIYEPIQCPTYKNLLDSEFVRWKLSKNISEGSYYNYTYDFPGDLNWIDKLDSGLTTADGKNIEYAVSLVPEIYVKATIMDGDNVLYSQIAIDLSNSGLNNITKDGYSLEGVYTDKECTKRLISGNIITGNTPVFDLHLYTKWTPKS